MTKTKKQQRNNTAVPAKGKSGNMLMAVGGAALLMAVFFMVKGNPAGNLPADAAAAKEAQQGGNVQIAGAEITGTASFIPYNAEGTYMELLAVRAPDGTVRTAFNTCQICYDSGQGYYTQAGDELVCQNCGNRFKISQIEKERNGCNPVPISAEDKQVEGETITISEGFLLANKGLFGG